MKAWVVHEPGPVDGHPLALVDRDVPAPGPGQILVEVSVCGVCRTDLHLAEGDLPAHGVDRIPGHEIVGRVVERGAGADRFEAGQRVGIPWVRATCGRCRFCRAGRENLCVSPRFTGWDDDGGYAEYAAVDEGYAYAIPERFSDQEAAPLLCAGIIGYRALRRSHLPPGGRLGIYGFGGSAHLAAEVARAEGASVYVMTRSVEARRLAARLGAVWTGGSEEPPPDALDAAILFAPAGAIVPAALAALDRGGTLAVAGIYLSDIPSLQYGPHLFQERQLRSVTANTRQDGEEFLRIAAAIEIEVQTTAYALEEADRALSDLAHDRVDGAAVLEVGG